MKVDRVFRSVATWASSAAVGQQAFGQPSGASVPELLEALVMQDDRLHSALPLQQVRDKVRLLSVLIAHVALKVPVQQSGKRIWQARGVLRPAEFVQFAMVFIGGAAWRSRPSWWSSCLKWMLSGTHCGCCLVRPFAEHSPGDGIARRPLSQASATATAVLAGAAEAQSYFRLRAQKFQEVVQDSHGTHIPFEARAAACVLFWLPRLLDIARGINRFDDNADEEYLAESLNDMTLLQPVLKWLNEALPQFRWPPRASMQAQYVMLIRCWRCIIRKSAAAMSEVWRVEEQGARFDWRLVQEQPDTQAFRPFP